MQSYTGSGNGEKDQNSKVPLEILIWNKTHSGDVGHTAIRIGNNVYGYYPPDTPVGAKLKPGLRVRAS